jgi:zinc protease
MFWMRLVEGGSYDPARIAAVDTLARDYRATSPDRDPGACAKYLRPDKDWSMMVVPEAGAK